MNRSVLALAASLASALALAGCSSAASAGMAGPWARRRPTAPMPEPDPVEAVPSGPVTAEPLPADRRRAGHGAAAPTSPRCRLRLRARRPPAARPRRRLDRRDGRGRDLPDRALGAPALDLYRASASGCSGDLARVNAWDYRDGEVYLYQSGGTVAARLRGGGGGLSGVIAKSGAPLTLAR